MENKYTEDDIKAAIMYGIINSYGIIFDNEDDAMKSFMLPLIIRRGASHIAELLDGFVSDAMNSDFKKLFEFTEKTKSHVCNESCKPTEH